MEIKSICIVGGGSAGWVTALSLLKHLPEISVTVVESKDIPSIGVGEATQPIVSEFIHDYLGFKEEYWMKECDATFKLALRFNQFNNNTLKDYIYHTFWSKEELSYHLYDWALKKQLYPLVPTRNYTATFFKSHYMCEYGRFDSRNTENILYAHHMDAGKFADLCKKECLNKGITYHVGTVEKINKDVNGIKSVILNTSLSIESDLFIDCTGFSALLIEKALGSPFTSMGDKVPNDKAIAVRVPYTDKDKELISYTGCSALSSGWAWEVPLWSRIGTGYVYSSKYLSEEEALEEFQIYLKAKYPAQPIEELDFKFINTRVGYREAPWVKNTLSIGLSSQFLEPLESTGLVFIVNNIKHLITSLKANNYCNQLMRDLYNKDSESLFLEAYWFIMSHYLNSSRQDSNYWRDMQYLEPPAELTNIINNIRNSGDWSVGNNRLFSEISWQHILIGFNLMDYTNISVDGERLDIIKHKHRIDSILSDLKKRKTKNKIESQAMPSHYQYLKDNIYGNDSDSR